MKTPLSALLVAAISLGGVAADEKKSILLHDENHEPGAGTTVVEKFKMKMKTEKMSMSFGDQKFPASMESAGKEETRGTYLTKDKVRLVKVSSVSTSTITLDGEVQPPDAEKDVLEGIPILIERVDGKWSGRFEKGKPNKEQREEIADLVKDFNFDDDEKVYGTKPRKIGDTWKVDAAHLPSFDEGEMTGKVSLTLVGERVYRGMRCAILEGSINATMKMDEDEDDLAMTIKGDVEILRSLEHFQDVKFSVSGSMKMVGQSPAGPGAVKFEAEGPVEFSGTVEIGKAGAEPKAEDKPKTEPALE